MVGENESELNGVGSRVLELGWAKDTCGKGECIASMEPLCTVWSGWVEKLTWRGLTVVGRVCGSCRCCEVEVGFCCISANCLVAKEESSKGGV